MMASDTEGVRARVVAARERLQREAVNVRAFAPNESGIKGREATPETLRKAQRGTIERIMENDRRRERAGRPPVLLPEHLEAAWEIERIYLAIVQSLMPKRMSFERRDPTNRDPGLVVPPSMRYAYRERYKPWADHLSALRVQGGPPVMLIVIDTLIDGRDARTIERELHMRNGSAVTLLVQGFDTYARLAGWLR